MWRSTVGSGVGNAVPSYNPYGNKEGTEGGDTKKMVLTTDTTDTTDDGTMLEGTKPLSSRYYLCSYHLFVYMR